jgi:anti-anti-sigma factor
MGSDLVTISVDRRGSAVVITLAGELDLDVQEQVDGAIAAAAALEGITAIRVNTTAIRFVDSTGLQTLLRARQLAEDRNLRFTLDIAHNGPVLRVIQLFGMNEQFDLEA